jgi:hypothetical protein
MTFNHNIGVYDIEGGGVPIALEYWHAPTFVFGPSMLQNYLRGGSNNVTHARIEFMLPRDTATYIFMGARCCF